MASAARRLFESRHVDPSAVSVPVGYRVEVAAIGLNCPACIEFDEEGHIFVGEMGTTPGSAYEPGRVVRVREDGSTAVIADGFTGAITGMAFREGAFYVIEHAESSRVYWLGEDGTRQLIVDGIPGGGDNPTSDIVLAHSERLYFGQGTRTNSGVVGLDNAGWAYRHTDFHDIPGTTIQLTGQNFVGPNLFGGGTVWTGAFHPFGEGDFDGQMVQGSPKASGSIMRVSPDAGEFELFAWGFRRLMGVAVHPDGRIFCTDAGMEPRGSRPIAGGGEYLWHILHGGWYGWPDYEGGEPVTDEKFKPENGAQPAFLIKTHPMLGGVPIASFPLGSGIARMDFSRSLFFGSDDTAFVAMMGGTGDLYGKSCFGHKLITVDTLNGDVADFASNRHPGSASEHRSGGLERPIAAKFDRTGEVLYLLDLGILEESSDGQSHIIPNTGVLWRIRTDEIAS